MTELQHELLNKYEEGLRKMVTEFLTEQKELEGQLLEVDELKDKWKRDKCSLVLFITTPERVDRSEYYFVNNAIKMPLEGQYSFEYNDDETTDSEE